MAIKLLETIRNAGHTAYFAGGCVRDSLMGREPKDYDIATSATPDQVKTLFPDGDTIGAHFGVILVKRGGFHFEIATFRQDGEYSDGRRPDSVRFSDAENDALRRDFTINGLFEDPITGEIVDFVGGREDLADQVLRAIGEPSQRFAEDYLRLLRAVRFAAVLDFKIDVRTWLAIQDGARNIAQIAPERIREELDKIWRHSNRGAGFDLLVESGLMAVILPEVSALQGCGQWTPRHPAGDVFQHIRDMLNQLRPEASLTLVLSVIFHDIGKPATRKVESDFVLFPEHEMVGAVLVEMILKRLKYSNVVIETVTQQVLQHMSFRQVKWMRQASLKRLMARQTFDEELELHWVNCLCGDGCLENYEFLLRKREEFAHQPLIPKPFLNGHDLLARGIPPGPGIGVILTEAHDLQIEGNFACREECLSWLDKRLVMVNQR